MRQALLAVVLLLPQGNRRADPFAPARLRATVSFLASDEMRGRGTGSPEGKMAAEWIAERFEKIGLEPANNGSFFHEFRFGGKECRNVAGILRAPPPAREFVVVGAHHDHLGGIGKTIYPGADDNASGVAGVLALAEHFAARKKGLKRHMVFVSYDAEEKGLIGSKRFVGHGVIAIDKTVFMLVFDLIGGVFLPGQEQRVYALGSEHSKAVRAVLEQHRKAEALEAIPLGTYLIEPVGPAFARSDYSAYRAKHVPYLFMTAATPWYYHTPFDRPELLDYEKASRTLGIARAILADIVTSTKPLDFVAKPAGEVQDARDLVRMIESVLERQKELRISERRAGTLRAHVERLAKLTATDELGGRGKRACQMAIMDLLRVARSYRPPGWKR